MGIFYNNTNNTGNNNNNSNNDNIDTALCLHRHKKIYFPNNPSRLDTAV